MEEQVILMERIFSGCSSLHKVTLPRNMPAIGYATFRDCSSLKGIAIPSTVQSIGDSAFIGCTSLDSVCSYIEHPFEFGHDAFKDISPRCVLTVPFGKRDAYIAAGWTEQIFKGGIKEMPEPAGIRPVTIGRSNSAYYDLQGRRTAVPQKGKIYIHQGRKIRTR